MPGVDLLTAGEAFEDLIFLGLPRLPRPGEEIKTREFLTTIGGGAVITAVAAARLGARVGIVSAVSAPAARRLRTEGVRVRDLRRPDEPHAISAALSTRTNRTFVTYNGVNEALEPRLLAALRRASARHVHLAFYPARCRRWIPVVEALRRRGISTSWDFGWNDGLLRDPGFLPLVSRLDYLFLNEQEDRLYARHRRLDEALSFWRAHVRHAIVKLGARGAHWVSAQGDWREPAPRVRTIDTTGAGDAFNGGFLTARLAGRDRRACLRAGNRCGALSTRAAGGLDGLPRERMITS